MEFALYKFIIIIITKYVFGETTDAHEWINGGDNTRYECAWAFFWVSTRFSKQQNPGVKPRIFNLSYATFLDRNPDFGTTSAILL